MNSEDTIIITANNQVLEFTEQTTPNIQELNLRKTNLTDQQLENNEAISRNDELTMNSETISSKQVLEDIETVTSNLDQQIENREAISSNQEFERTEDLSGNDVLENTEVLPAIRYE